MDYSKLVVGGIIIESLKSHQVIGTLEMPDAKKV
jgi:hypothetical protein